MNILQDNEAANLRSQHKLNRQDNPLITAMDSTLQQFQVRRQAYFGGTFCGNHVHKCLKVYLWIKKEKGS